MNYHYIANFEKSRKNRIGASDVPWLIPHPIRQIESLAAYTDDKGNRHANTANDLYEMKVNNIKSESGFPAEMGHYLEGRILREFIADNIDSKIADDFFRGYMMHKMDQDAQKTAINPEPYNNTPFKHNTEAEAGWGVAHGDIVYHTDYSMTKKLGLEKDWIIKKNGLIIDLSKPFLIEAKSARYWSARRKEDPYNGYDLDLYTWQGIPLRIYFQCQFQMLLYDVDVCYVALLFDTSSKHYWQIQANKKHQDELQQLAMYMKKCIDTKTPPKDLLMNSKDIRALYPEIKEDFKEVKDDELKTIIQTAKKYIEAKEQEKAWKEKKEQYEDTISIHLKDTQLLKGNINGMFLDLAKWKETGGGEYTMSLKDIRSREDAQTIERYLKRKKLIKQSQKNRKPSIMIKEKDLEGWEDE